MEAGGLQGMCNAGTARHREDSRQQAQSEDRQAPRRTQSGNIDGDTLECRVPKELTTRSTAER